MTAIRPDRLAVLRLIAEGKRPEVQRTRLKWLVDNGWLVTHSQSTTPGAVMDGARRPG